MKLLSPSYTASLALGLCLLLGATAGYAKSIVVKAEKNVPITVTTVAEGLKNPWGLAFLPDGRMLVTERSGQMRIVSQDGTKGPALAGLPEIFSQGQGGLLDVVLAPDFAKSKHVYFSYSEPSEDGKTNGTAVAYGTLNGDKLDDVTRVFRQQPKIDSGNHFGSRLVWAPDGTLFITLGERYSEKEQAQTLDNHLGKVVRIKADGSVPKDNPFVGKPGALPEIWSYGHRNVQGAGINPVSKELWTGEHGPQGGDEINIDRAGKNYGWPVITYGENYGGGPMGDGGFRKAGMEQPIHYWVPSIATCGFAFYTGDKFPQWKNNLFVSGLNGQVLSRLVLDGNKVIHEERLLNELGARLRHVVQGPDGLIYLLSDDTNGKIFRLEPAKN